METTLKMSHRCTRSIYILPVLIVVLVRLHRGCAQIDIAKGLSNKTFYSQGDIMIGILSEVTGTDTSQQDCSDDALNLWEVSNLMLMAHLFDEANAAHFVHPNWTVGFKMIDYCGEASFALAQSNAFLPSPGGTKYAAVICCSTSSPTTLVSTLTSVYRIPQISYSATSDALSDKSVHKYFMRLVPPDQYQVQVMVDMLTSFGWSYVSFLYVEGPYGDDANKLFEQLTKARGICISYSKRIFNSMTDDDYHLIVKQLIENRSARVVAVFLYDSHLNKLFAQLRTFNVTDWFIWLGSDGWYDNIDVTPGFEDIGVGGFSLRPSQISAPELSKFIERVNPTVETRNSWLATYWQQQFQCSWSNRTCNATAVISAELVGIPLAAGIHDMIFTILQGLKQYLPALGAHIDAFDNSQFLDTLHGVRFDGANGPVAFDSRGDMLGSYTIVHGIRTKSGYSVIPVGTWSVSNLSLSLNRSLLQWYRGPNSFPASVCSLECLPGEIKLQRELPCCWECFKCRENEYVSNGSRCIACPAFTWPDINFTRCWSIPPRYQGFDSPLGNALVIIGIVGIVLTAGVAGIFIKHHSKQLIKSSCREASVVILVGIMATFASLFVPLGIPTPALCFAERFVFHLNPTLIYASILIKIGKIYRIFLSGRRSTRVPKFIGTRTQLIIIAFIVLVELAILLISLAVRFPNIELVMPLPTQPVVDLTCTEAFDTILLGLSFNLLLQLASAFMAFKARKLPDNFNESAQIAFCVSTTAILWIVFVPSYISAPLAFHRTMLVSMVKIISAFVALFSLFAPKIYALLFVVEENMKFGAHAVNRIGNTSNNSNSTSNETLPSTNLTQPNLAS